MMTSNKYAYEYACVSACTNWCCSTAEPIQKLASIVPE